MILNSSTKISNLLVTLSLVLISQVAQAEPTQNHNIMTTTSLAKTDTNIAPDPTSRFSRFNPKNATFVFQAGAFSASQGNAQQIGITGLIGDRFTVTHDYGKNALLGLGYYVRAMDKSWFNMMYGLNAFYLAHTSVEGYVIQEGLFTNLSYRYSLTNYPIYAAIKTLLYTNNSRFNITLDLGMGPNIIKTRYFHEHSLDGVTLPDTIFSGETNVVWSATAGIGIKLNNIIARLPLEIGYRFFYLGQGHLDKQNDQVVNTLNTGNNYANALLISTSV